MKTLPDNPNLDHLRQQAKDLLPQLRAAKQSASLSDAQASVAEQYGFRTWTDLKAEVDHRRASVRAASPALAHDLANAFGLGRPAAPMLPVERAWAGQTWALETDRGRWNATELFDWTPTDNVETEAALVEAALGAGVRAPRPVRDVGGGVIADVDGRRWRVHESIKLGPEPMMPASPGVAAAVGRVLAKLHGLALPAPGPVQPWLTRRPAESQWNELLARATSAAVPWAPLLARAIPGFVEVAAIRDDDTAATPILSHCSVGHTSVRMADGNELVVLGWEHSGTTPPRWELGGALASWSSQPDGALNERAARAMVEAYRDEGGSVDALGLAMFTSHIAGGLNWTRTRVAIALGDDGGNEARRAEAARQVPDLLKNPTSRSRLERILEVVVGSPTSAR